VAAAVARSLIEIGAAPPLAGSEIDRRINSMVWEPTYRPYRPVAEPAVVGGRE
jgi:hypothetical protein